MELNNFLKLARYIRNMAIMSPGFNFNDNEKISNIVIARRYADVYHIGIVIHESYDTLDSECSHYMIFFSMKPDIQLISVSKYSINMTLNRKTSTINIDEKTRKIEMTNSEIFNPEEKQLISESIDYITNAVDKYEYDRNAITMLKLRKIFDEEDE